MTKLTCRLTIDPPREGAWNMAVDEVLLESAVNEGVATLRFYEWSAPTLSLGYFQRYEEREAHAASRGRPCVRRHSGGGAIVHDRELTYSLALPASAPQAGKPENLYRRTHEALVAILQRLAPESRSATAGLCDAAIRPTQGPEPFLCFQRRARCDVLLSAAPDGDFPVSIDQKHKVLGSAQRKRLGAVLQHGSLLLERSAAAPELPGLAELAHRTVEVSEVRELWRSELERRLGLTTDARGLTTIETVEARRIASEQFAGEAWTRRR